MSYDIRLVNPVSANVIQLPFKHIMTGGTYAAEYDEVTGEFTPLPIAEATLNITYNYSRYYKQATDGDERFGTDGGIRGIYGKTGAESIPMLKDMISRIEEAYKSLGEWISTTRHRIKYTLVETGAEITLWDILHYNLKDDQFIKEKYDELVCEGDTGDYWEGTAANAIIPLKQLLIFAQLRPDGVWEGD